MIATGGVVSRCRDSGCLISGECLHFILEETQIMNGHYTERLIHEHMYMHKGTKEMNVEEDE